MAALALVYGAATCNTSEPAGACPTPEAGSEQHDRLQRAHDESGFEVLYPCYLPNTETLTVSTIVGDPGRQQVELVWAGTFDMTIRQSQYPPAVGEDPAGASRVAIDLFPNVPATLIERNDASGAAMYHLFWQDENIYYELQAFGPPQQRRIILDIARSLE